MAEEYVLEGSEEVGTIEAVYESYRGDYWVVTDNSGRHPFGYAMLANMPPAFAEWGTFNRDNIKGKGVWEVPKENWTFTGPEQLNIVSVHEA
jgi:hypothetical protein